MYLSVCMFRLWEQWILEGKRMAIIFMFVYVIIKKNCMTSYSMRNMVYYKDLLYIKAGGMLIQYYSKLIQWSVYCYFCL
jgi:hypothetical protein